MGLNRRALLLAPLGVAAVGGGAFYAMLRGMQSGRFDPRGVPSMLIGHPAPSFTLPGQGGPGFSSADLSGCLINFFASWCAPCIEEAPVLLALKERGVRLFGVAYRDKLVNTAGFLARNGDPYERIGRDEEGRVAIDWGVTGVPETYFVDARGMVRWRLTSPMTPDIVDGELLPMLSS